MLAIILNILTVFDKSDEVMIHTIMLAKRFLNWAVWNFAS